MDERMRFIARLNSGERMSDLCREFGISRKTGYKFRSRYKDFGMDGLKDDSRKPKTCKKTRIPAEVESRLLDIKREHSNWGSLTVRKRFRTLHPGLRVPARSTIDKIFERHGLVKQRRKRNRVPASTKLREAKAANDLWCADYKGEFRLGNREYCYPLTITDQYSRCLLCCDAYSSTCIDDAMRGFAATFDSYGVPKAIRTDNGIPFVSTGLLGLTKLSVYFLKLGIELERIEPGHPEQNGRHERMHLTLKQETTRPAQFSLLQQQEIFDGFQNVFNNIRPHQGIELRTPASIYTPSTKKLKLGTTDPSLFDDMKTVTKWGHLQLMNKHRFYLTTALVAQDIGIRQLTEDQFLIQFMNLQLGIYHAGIRRFEPAGSQGQNSV